LLMRFPFVVPFPINVGLVVKPSGKVVKKLASTLQCAARSFL
jgi:hypothetical protein